MFKNKQKHFLISMLLMVLFLATLGTAFSADLNETLEAQEVSMNEDNLENSQNNVVQSSQTTLNGGDFSIIQNAINNADDGETIYLKGTYTAQNNASEVYINKNVKIIGDSSTLLDGKNISRIFSIQESGSKCLLSNLKFVNGHSGYGGAVIILGKDVTIENSVFENNYANHGGGAIYVLSEIKDPNNYPKAGENLVIKNCNFTNNFAKITAGAIGVYGNNTQVIGCNFVSNRVKPSTDREAYGGAIQIGRDGYNLKDSVLDCNFINNHALTYASVASHGGAGCVRDGVIYQNCKFINNSASQGGALTYHASGSIKDCIFINNSASLYGGALSTGYVDMDMDLKVINCNFDGNRAPYGGAIQLKGKNIEIKESEFNKNIASINGGAVNIVAKTVTINNDEFNKNIAYVNGGAVYINGDKTTVVSSSFVANEAIPNVKNLDDGLGGAIYINSSAATVNNNTFNYNVARNGSAIYYDKYGLNCVILDNRMSENQAWVYELPVYAKDIYYGENGEISATIFGGNNIAKYGDLSVSNAIYNAAKQDKIKVNGETPILGAIDNGKLYQDSREYNMDVLLVVSHEDGSVVFNKTLKSDYKGHVSEILENLKPGKYKVTATHFEDTYYKYITNTTYFSVYPKADLQVNKDSSIIDANYGDVVIWTLKVTNNGPNMGTEIELKDLIPEGLVILSCDAENYNRKTGILNIGSLNVGESKIINIKTSVNKTGTFINNASVSGKEHDWNLANNNDSASIKVNSSADLAIVKLVNNTNPNYNDLVKWTLRVTNNGPDRATGVVVSDVIPSGLSYVSSSGGYNASSGMWNIGTLDSGKSAVIDIVTLVNRTGSIVNEANVSGNEYDWNLSNNYDSAGIDVNSSADLAIVKLVNDTNPNYKDLVKWTLRATNNGPNTATGVVVCDILPDGLVSVDKSFNGIWNVGQLLVNQTKELTIVCLVNKTGKIVNRVNITGNEYDWNLDNNNDSVSIDVNSSSDLAIEKLVNDTNPRFNSWVKWTLKVTNNGPNTATEVIVDDLLPKTLVYVSSTANYNVISGEWSIGTLESGKSVSIDIITLVNKTGTIVNEASVSGREYDWNLSNNNDSVSIDVNSSADLAIVKLVNNTNPNYKDLVKWTLRATNNGPNTATGVVVCDILPDGLVSVDKSFNGIWNVGQLLVNQTKELTIICLVNKTGKIVNIANITGNEYDYNLANNIANKTIDISPSVDVFVKKYVNNTAPDFGEIVKWSIIVSNNGPDIATNVEVKDLLADGLILVKSSQTKGMYDVKSGIWTIDSLAPETNETLDIYCKVNKLGKILNVASVNSTEYDWNKSNNDDNESIDVVKVADLSVVKLVNNSNPNYKDLVKWTIIVKNNGPNDATGVVVNDLLPNALEYISSHPSKGYYNPVNGIWDIGDLGVGEELQLNIVSKIIKTGNITNLVSIKGNEKDNNSTNNNYEKLIYVKPAADLVIEKSVSKQEVKVGDLIDYLIEVTNNGPDSSENVKVSELLNPNLKLVSFKATKGNFDNKNQVLTIDSLASGEKALLTVSAVATACGNFENKVVVSSDTFDYDESNNHDEVSVFVSEDPIKMLKSIINNTCPQKLVKKSPVSDLGALVEFSSLESVELPKTGLPILLLILVSMISIGFLPIKISKKR